MALQLQLTYSNTNDGSDCKNIVLDDSTGVWNATTNAGGYQDEGGDASGNPKRSELALYILLTKKNPEATDADNSYLNDNSSADTIATWTIPVSGDGWYRGQSVSIPILDNAQAYGLNHIVWFSGSLYKCINPAAAGETPVSQPTRWELYEPTAANIRAIYDNPAFYSPDVTIYTGYLDFLQHCLGDEIYADAWKDVSDDRPSFYSADAATAITALLEGAKIAAARGNYQEADRKIIIVQDLGNNPNCKIC